MRIPEDIRKCVAFLEYTSYTGLSLVGTVFFVTMRSSNEPDHYFRYAVTAKHVIDHILSFTKDGKIFLRLNSCDGGILRIDSHVDWWFYHPQDKLVDVAIMPIPTDKT